jgi:hypothetical protein
MFYFLLSVRASNPGSNFPSKYSNDAPPPVDTCDTLTPDFSIADAESHPPTTYTKKKKK